VPVAAEVFVRWNHPDFGPMTPQLFLPVIDSYGESPRLLDAVVRRSLAAVAQLEAAGHSWRVSVNLGATDLQTGVAPDIVAAALAECGADPGSLVLEAPESALAEADALLLTALERLRALGCGVALDSGGALPVETSEAAAALFTEVKIGGAAIIRFAEIARKLDGGRIARRLSFARAHGLPSVAVGVESQQTLNALVKLGFTAVQGALIAKPQPLDVLLAWDGSWSGEAEHAMPIPELRPRPRLVVPAAPPPPPRLMPKLVEQLAPVTNGGFSFEEDEDEGLDVSFDDEAFGARPEEVLGELDPSEDVVLDGEEMRAMESAAPLHAGMIERPRQRRPERLAIADVAPAAKPVEEVERRDGRDRPPARPAHQGAAASEEPAEPLGLRLRSGR
jgi:EAL domain-containing protein (putative c-di-GMP-specific phosphodiesterase class I)